MTNPSASAERGKNNLYTLYDLAMLGIVNHSRVPLGLMTFSGLLSAAIKRAVPRQEGGPAMRFRAMRWCMTGHSDRRAAWQRLIGEKESHDERQSGAQRWCSLAVNLRSRMAIVVACIKLQLRPFCALSGAFHIFKTHPSQFSSRYQLSR